MFSDQRGVFVYEVLQRVRAVEFPTSSSGATSPGGAFGSASRSFQRGDLVSVDVVRRGYVDKYLNEVTYLRLSDGSGLWIPEIMTFPSFAGISSAGSGVGRGILGGGIIATNAMALVRPVQVETGLWTLHIDNCPLGQSLRHHPLDSPDSIVRRSDYKEPGASATTSSSLTPPRIRLASQDEDDDDDDEQEEPNPPVWYEAMQKVYCDRKVVSPTTYVAFYRVQGANKWLMDRRVIRNPDAAGVASGTVPVVLFSQMLVDAAFVRTGTFCFQATENLRVRSRCTVDEGAGTCYKVRKGTLVSVDAIRDGPDPSTGPFLRLSDGSGWLFVQKHGSTMMSQIVVQEGAWELKVLAPEGMVLQRHPAEANPHHLLDKKRRGEVTTTCYSEHEYPNGSMVQAVARVRILNPNHDSTFHEYYAADEPHSFIYYRIYGTRGWLADRHHTGKRALQVMTEDADTMCLINKSATGAITCSSTMAEGGSAINSWTLEFVRGVASTVPNLDVVRCTPSQCNPVIVFATAGRSGDGDCNEDDGIRKVVYCATRTVGILFESRRRPGTEDRNDRGEGAKDADGEDEDSDAEPTAPARWYRNCTTKDLWEHLRKDAVELMMNPFDDPDSDADEDDKPQNRNKEIVGNDKATDRVEETLRHELLALDKKIETTESKRMELIEKLRAYDEKRFRDAMAMRSMMEARQKEYQTRPESKDGVAAGSLANGSKHLETREGGASDEVLNAVHDPAAFGLNRSDSSSSRESSTEPIAGSNLKWKKKNAHLSVESDSVSTLPSALSTSPRSRRGQGSGTHADRVRWKDQPKHGRSRGPVRQPISEEREGFRSRTSTLLGILSTEPDESIEEDDSNTLISGSGQSFESETDDGSSEYDSY